MRRITGGDDPGVFRHLPVGSADLSFRGIGTGGGTDRMYVPRGTGHYGFPLRLGVPAEEGVLRIHRAG